MFLRHNVLGFTWALFILILSGIPGNQFGDSQHENLDKVIHVILFSVLYLLLLVGFIKQQRFNWLRSYSKIKTGVLCIAYGILIELLQSWIFVDRSIEFADMVSNCLGVVIGVGVFYLIYGNDSYA